MRTLPSFCIKTLTTATVVLALLGNPVAAATVKAVAADSFVEFIGTQGHLEMEDAVWGDPAMTWKTRLAELGTRYMRTSIGTSLQARNKAISLYRDHGVRLNVVINPRRSDGTLNPSRISPFVSFLRDQIGIEKVSSIEGPNEYSATKYEGNSDWAAELRSFQSQLYQQVNSDSRSAQVPVLAPTIWRRIVSDYNDLGSLSGSADNGNLHYYNGGRKPSMYKLERYFGDDVGVESRMNLAISNAKITKPGSPIFVTETGYNVQGASPSEGRITERVAAKYVLRLVSEFFLRRANIRRTYIYSLVDASADRQHGLLRRDLSRRPSFYAVKNAIALLSDKGPAFATGSLTYSLSGDLTGVRHAVLQKRDKKFYMMIWNDAVSWDRIRLVELNPPARQLTLDISQHAFKTMKIYRPTVLDLADPNHGVLPVRTINAPRSVGLSVPDHVLIVEMIP